MALAWAAGRVRQVRASYALAFARAFFRFGHLNRAKCFRVSSTERTGQGLFSKRAFRKGDLVFVVEGPARIFNYTVADYARYPNWFSVDKDIWIDPSPPYVFANHSCHPNLGIRDRREFVALRDIQADEELTFDYSITEVDRPWEMKCHCGHATCRTEVRSIHYLPPEQFESYLPNIPPHFQRLYRSERSL